MKKTIWKKLLCLITAAALSLSAFTLFACGKENTPPAEKTLTKIEVYKPPLKTEYFIGEEFDKSGLRILAYYSDDTAEVVTNFTYEPTTPLTAENDKITVTYTEKEVSKTCTQTISVKPVPAKPSGIKIETEPLKTEYTEGEKFDPAGMSVKLKLDDESTGSDVTSDITYEPFGALTTKDTEVTVSYKYGDDTFTEKVAITVKEGVATIAFGGGTYQKAHDIVLGVDETAYELSGGLILEDWTFNGTYQDAPFKRARSTTANKYSTFTLDFSSVTDKSEIGFSANLIKSRPNPLITVSTDKQKWEHIGFQEGTPKHVYNSDYNEKVTHLRGREVNDANLHRMYWSLADYADAIGDDGLLYVRFGFTSDYENTLAKPEVGADVIDGVTYYEKITFDELDNRFTLTLGDGVSFKSGGKTAVLRPGRFMPEVVFDDEDIEASGVSWTDNAGKVWKNGDFRMPGRDVTVDMVYDNEKFTLTLGDGMTFDGGGKTASLRFEDALPNVTFETGVDTSKVYLLGDNGKAWKSDEFKMPNQNLTLSYVTVVNPYIGNNGYSGQTATEEGQYLLGDGTYSFTPSGVTIPNSGRGELAAMSDGKLAQLYKLPKMADGYTFRLQTTPKRDTNENYTYDIDYTFYNLSDREITVTVYQVNSGTNTSGCQSGTVTLAAGESKTVSLKDVGFSGVNNFLTYFVFNGATADEFPIAIHSYFTPKPAA